MSLDLSERQAQILRLSAAGHPGKVIARRLSLSLSTVRTDLDHARALLGARNIAHACALAVHHGIVTAADLEETP